jgi:hypothetical protein
MKEYSWRCHEHDGDQGCLMRLHADPAKPAAGRDGAAEMQMASGALATGLLLAEAFVQFCAFDASAAEVCRFAGTTDSGGHVVVTTDVAAIEGVTKVDVAARFSTTMFWLHIEYLFEELSIWRAGELESVAVNSRYLVGKLVVRQQWDQFRRGTDGLQAYRVQAKTLTDFRRNHPGFVQHWDPATFGQPWVGDYIAAPPERRTDLDLKASPFPSGLRSPLAMAFYWVRWLPHRSLEVPVFLPGFKHDRLVNLSITATTSLGGTVWRAPLRYPALSESLASTATAWTSPDGHLLQLTVDVHHPNVSGRGLIKQQGCEGTPVVPILGNAP